MNTYENPNTMESAYQDILKCVDMDEDITLEQMFICIVEETGETGTALLVEHGVKNKVLSESKESEACDIIISALGFIAKNPEWNLDRIVETMKQKIPKWESRLKGAKNVEGKNS